VTCEDTETPYNVTDVGIGANEEIWIISDKKFPRNNRGGKYYYKNKNGNPSW
jgi:hypothetical protein